MKKRHRKKKHVGEYTEWGRQFVITRNRRDGFDDFFDAFIEEAIEANGLYCGGGGKESRLNVVVELGRDLTQADEKTNLIVEWLKSRLDVKEWRMGEVFDVWHGDYEDIDDDEIRVTAVV
jgi:uncharacterized protein YggL (DUF469 family)